MFQGQRFGEAEHVTGFRGPMQIERFTGGQSNPTYRVRTSQAAYVPRRKPLGALVKSAHAVEREAHVIEALGKTGFPVPKVFGLCEDTGVIGSAFFVMEYVGGRIFWDASFSDLPRERRAAPMDAMLDRDVKGRNEPQVDLQLRSYHQLI